jgi:hypothetical protein
MILCIVVGIDCGCQNEMNFEFGVTSSHHQVANVSRIPESH